MAFGHFKWLELPPPASTLTFFHRLHSFVYLIFHFRHTTKNQRGKPAYMYTLQHCVTLTLSTEQSVAELCSGPPKYFTQDQAKGCLHVHPPGAKWWGLTLTTAVWRCCTCSHLSQASASEFCYKNLGCLDSWLLYLSLNYKGKMYIIPYRRATCCITHNSEKKRSPMHDS